MINFGNVPRSVLRGPAIVAEEKECFIDNLIARIHYIIVMIGFTGLALWKFEFPFPPFYAVEEGENISAILRTFP
jgi:hypothetical protein